MPTIASSTTAADPRIRSAIARAASTAGVDFDYLFNQARVESSLDPAARASTSSAAGLFQFTRQTWLETIEKHGSSHGLGWAADAIERSGGRLTVADPQLRDAIDRLRYDPEASSTMAAEFAADNRQHLETGLGRTADPVDLYLAHFLGSAGALDFLRAHDVDNATAAAPLFPAAAAANRSIFYRPDGGARSLGEIRTNFAAKLGGRVPAVGGSLAAAPAPPWNTARRTDVSESIGRAPMTMAAFEAMPQRLSIDFAARAYARLSGLGA